MGILKDKFTAVKNMPAQMAPHLKTTETDKNTFAENINSQCKGQDDRKRCESFKESED